MFILGISCYYHDAAAALLSDGVLVAAAQEERFSRIKHDSGFPNRSIDYCLTAAGIRPQDLECVVFYEKPLRKFERILTSALATFPRSWGVFRESMLAWFNQKLWIKGQLMERFGLPASKVLFVDHHLSHAASAFFCSPFERAALLTMDGVGEWTTAAVGSASADWGRGGTNSIRLTEQMNFPHSLGLLYSAFTAFLGFEVNEGEYKVMGMAPYGQPRFVDDVLKTVKVADDGSLRLNMDYFAYHFSLRHSFSAKFTDLFGPPRVPEAPFITRLTDPGAEVSDATHNENQHYADIAASIQAVTEDVVLKAARHAYSATGCDRLCMAGGVALNSVANGRLVRETPFKEVFIQPAAGDAGGALGAALYAHHVLFQKPRRFVMEHCFWGASYTQDQALAAVKRSGLPFTIIDDEEELVETAARDLSAGRVVGWFHGGFEWGPRALGNRSILADPRRAEMKDIVNSKIKFREAFRPFAPAIPSERVGEFFEGAQTPQMQQLARFMLLVLPWRPGKGELVQAVNHMGTGRVQAVCQTSNPLFYRLLRRFGDETGTPVLLNTSFNLRGEPIVSSPEDALRSFQASGIDTMMLDRIWVRKA
ncbi:MAG: hypothetical protein EHM23_18245 [Acidobacteria bacterium]|nr:MAG: hypothetical protein EHM23_18245 [Acidobacteriota bacterium]